LGLSHKYSSLIGTDCIYSLTSNRARKVHGSTLARVHGSTLDAKGIVNTWLDFSGYQRWQWRRQSIQFITFVQVLVA
jgi:hypothetical protein